MKRLPEAQGFRGPTISIAIREKISPMTGKLMSGARCCMLSLPKRWQVSHVLQYWTTDDRIPSQKVIGFLDSKMTRSWQVMCYMQKFRKQQLGHYNLCYL